MPRTWTGSIREGQERKGLHSTTGDTKSFSILPVRPLPIPTMNPSPPHGKSGRYSAHSFIGIGKMRSSRVVKSKRS